MSKHLHINIRRILNHNASLGGFLLISKSNSNSHSNSTSNVHNNRHSNKILYQQIRLSTVKPIGRRAVCLSSFNHFCNQCCVCFPDLKVVLALEVLSQFTNFIAMEVLLTE